MTQGATMEAVRRSILVRAPVERAFQVFTEGIGGWWPGETHVIGGQPATAMLEGRQGGRWYERAADGSECDWGTVLAWEPPHRVVLAWQIDGQWRYDPDPARATEVEVRFSSEDGGTRVELEHRGFERLGEGAEALRSPVDGDGGWTGLLARYGEAAAA